MMISDTVMFIMEYAVVDSLGRAKEWRFAGLTTDPNRVRARRTELLAANTAQNLEFRVSRYSHAHGKNA